jgi:rhodanese-related sulfurtransferase
MTRETITRYALPILLFLLVLGFKSWMSRPDTSTDQVRTLLQQGATLIDVRSPGEFASGHIQGAINIPVDQIALRAREIPTDKPVVLYCRSGARSSSAASTLRGLGFARVYNAGAMSNLQ